MYLTKGSQHPLRYSKASPAMMIKILDSWGNGIALVSVSLDKGLTISHYDVCYAWPLVLSSYDRKNHNFRHTPANFDREKMREEYLSRVESLSSRLGNNLQYCDMLKRRRDLLYEDMVKNTLDPSWTLEDETFAQKLHRTTTGSNIFC